MTNKQIIKELKSKKFTISRCVDVESCRKYNNAVDMAILIIKENEELKTEIIQLKTIKSEEKTINAFSEYITRC